MLLKEYIIKNTKVKFYDDYIIEVCKMAHMQYI